MFNGNRLSGQTVRREQASRLFPGQLQILALHASTLAIWLLLFSLGSFVLAGEPDGGSASDANFARCCDAQERQPGIAAISISLMTGYAHSPGSHFRSPTR